MNTLLTVCVYACVCVRVCAYTYPIVGTEWLTDSVDMLLYKLNGLLIVCVRVCGGHVRSHVPTFYRHYEGIDTYANYSFCNLSLNPSVLFQQFWVGLNCL